MTAFLKTFSRARCFLNSNDAVSEMLNFILIVGILVVSLSIIGLAGYPILKNAQKNMYVGYSSQSFIAMANNINKVVTGQAPSRSMELNMYGAKFSITGSSTINITARNSTNQRITLVDQQMRSIESSVDDTIIAYEGTGIWVKYPDGTSVNLHKPLISYQDNMLVIPVVNINGVSSTSGNGMSRITVKGVPGIASFDNVSEIKLRINSSYRDGWRRYYGDVISWDYCDTDECTVELNRSDMDVYILNIQLDTEIE